MEAAFFPRKAFPMQKKPHQRGFSLHMVTRTGFYMPFLLLLR